MNLQKNRSKTKAMLFSLAALLSVGCVGGATDDDSVPYQADADTSSDTRRSDEPIGYDTDIQPNASFNFNLTGLPFVGVNMSSAEWDGGARATEWPNQYLTPGYASFLQYFRGWGMTTVRLPFKWEYLQPDLSQPFNEEEFTQLKTTVFWLRKYNAKVLIDMHNYARYGGNIIGSADEESGEIPVTHEDYADAWRRLAETFKAYPEVMFGIMNEPRQMSTAQWVVSANAAIAAIRETGAKNLIFVNGNGWSGAHSWNQYWTDDNPDVDAKLTNAEAMLQIVDPLGDDYTIFEAHQYLNEISSDWGECTCSPNEERNGCTAETVGSYRMQNFTDWLRTNNKKGFLGEFGVNDDATCIAALDDHLKHIEDNDDVYVGWAWWAAGPGCATWQYPIDPYCWSDESEADLKKNGIDGDLVPKQLKMLVKHLATY